MEKIRNTNIEVLRFLLMASILLWHVLVHGYDLKGIGSDEFSYTGKNIPISLFLASIVLPATYCFVFISGYFGMHLRFRKLAELLIWCVIVSVCQTLFVKYFLGMDVGMKDLYQSFFPITSHRWWFMTAYVQLFLMAPFLNFGMEYMDRKEKLVIIGLIYCVSLFHLLIGEPNSGSSFFGLAFMYLLGRYFHEYGINDCLISKNIKKTYILCLICLFGILCFSFYFLGYLRIHKAQKIVFYLMGFSNPLIVIMAVCLFFITLRFPIRKNKYLNKILAPNLFIYLLTEGFMGGQIYKKIAIVFENDKCIGCMLFVSVLIICLLIGHIIQNLTKHILNICCNEK